MTPSDVSSSATRSAAYNTNAARMMAKVAHIPNSAGVSPATVSVIALASLVPYLNAQYYHAPASREYAAIGLLRDAA